MSLISTNGLLGSRSIEALAGAETLFSQPGGLTADATTTQLASLIPLDLLQSQDAAAEGAPPDAAQGGAVAAPDAVSALANTTSVASLLAGGGLPLSSGQLGDPIVALGLSLADAGHNGNQTLVADVADLPGEISGLNDTSGNVADALYNLGGVTGITGGFVNDVTETVTGAAGRPLVDTANKAIMDFHYLIEGATHDIGLTGVAHGITNLGETIGLGKIGADNLLTDILTLPQTVLSGGDVLGSVGHIGSHLGGIVSGVTGIVSPIAGDLGSGPDGLGLLGPDGIIGGTGLDLSRLDDVLGQTGGGPLGAGGNLVGNLTNTLDLVGSNAAGGGNLVTDVLKLPGELLTGNGTPSLTDAGHQLDVTLIATGDLANHVIGAIGGGMGASPNGLIGAVGTGLDGFAASAGPATGLPLTLAGVAGTVDALASQSAGGVVSGVVTSVDGALTDLSHDIALAGFSGAGGPLADSLVGSLVDNGAVGTPILASVIGVIETGHGESGSLLAPVTSLLDNDHHGQPLGGLGLI